MVIYVIYSECSSYRLNTNRSLLKKNQNTSNSSRIEFCIINNKYNYNDYDHARIWKYQKMSLKIWFLWSKENIVNRAVVNWKPHGKIPRGRFKKKGFNAVEENLNRLGVREWRGIVQYWKKRSEIVMKVKTLRE